MIGSRYACAVKSATPSLGTVDIQLADQMTRRDIYLSIYEKQTNLSLECNTARAPRKSDDGAVACVKFFAHRYNIGGPS